MSCTLPRKEISLKIHVKVRKWHSASDGFYVGMLHALLESLSYFGHCAHILFATSVIYFAYVFIFLVVYLYVES